MAEYIERETVKNRMQAHYDFYLRAYGGFNNMPLDCKARADELVNCIAEVVNSPAADVVEVKHGRWITHRDKLTSCSECHTLGSPQWKGCPVCLARMDGE